jgi:hypothetical protein
MRLLPYLFLLSFAFAAESPITVLGDFQPTVLATLTNQVALYPGESATSAFNLTVPGNVPFHVTKVELSCGCLGTDPLPNDLVAGSTTLFSVHLHGDAKIGSKIFRVRILGTRGDEAVAFQCVIESRVHDELTRIEGWRMVNLPSLSSATSPGGVSIAFTRGSHPDRWQTLRTTITGSGGSWEAAPIITGDQVLVNVGFRPAGLVGEVIGRIHFSFFSGARELPYHPSLTVLAHVPGSVHAVPSTVLLGAVVLGETKNGHFDLEASGKDPVPTISEVTTSDVHRLQAVIRHDGGQWGIDVTLSGQEPLGQASGWIDITFADGPRTCLRVPYLAVMGKAAAEAEK